MASFASTTAASTGATPVDLLTAADAISCLAELVEERLGALQAAVREHGAGAADLHDWHLSGVLLGLAIEQADTVKRAVRSAGS